jgi:hypothetical protein
METLTNSEKIVQQFLQALFDPDDLLVIRLIESWTVFGKKETRHVLSRHLHPGQLTGALWQQLLERAERERANLFFGACPRTRAKADKGTDIRIVRALWDDLDDVAPEDAKIQLSKAGLPDLSISINSGHGAHAYWLLADPYVINDYPAGLVNGKRALSPKAQKIQAIVQGIAGLADADHTFDLPRLMRLPGTFNRKNERNGVAPAPCELVECHPERRYPLTDFERFALPAPSASPQADNNANPGAGWPHWYDSILEPLFADCLHPYDNDRSRADFRLCCEAIRKGVPKDAIKERLLNIGKSAERGEAYFTGTWQNAKDEVERATSA